LTEPSAVLPLCCLTCTPPSKPWGITVFPISALPSDNGHAGMQRRVHVNSAVRTFAEGYVRSGDGASVRPPSTSMVDGMDGLHAQLWQQSATVSV